MNNTALTALLGKCKVALRVTTNAYDSEITDLINASFDDLIQVNAIQDLSASDNNYPADNALIVRAIVTYVKAYFGRPDNYEQLLRAYNDLKAQLKTATGYTEWGDE